MTIEELFALISSCWSQNTFQLTAGQLAGTSAAKAISGHFENGSMRLQQATQPVLHDGVVRIESGTTQQVATRPGSARASVTFQTNGTDVFLKATLVPEGQTENGFSLAELYPKLQPVYLSGYRFTETRFTIDSQLAEMDFAAQQEKYAGGLFHPAEGTTYSAQLKFDGKLQWPVALQPLQKVFGTAGFNAEGFFQLVNGMPRYFIRIECAAVTLNKLTLATYLELAGVVLDSIEEPLPDTQPEADAMHIFAGVASLPQEIAANAAPVRFETYWQVAVPSTLTIRAEQIKDIPGTLQQFCKALLGLDFPGWENIPGLPAGMEFNLDALEIVFDAKALSLLSFATQLSLRNTTYKVPLIPGFLDLDSIQFEAGLFTSENALQFYGNLRGNFTINSRSAEDGLFFVQLDYPSCTFSAGLDETSTFNASDLIRQYVPLLPPGLSLVVDELYAEGNILSRSCSFSVSLGAGTSIDLFLFRLEEFSFWFNYGQSNMLSPLAAGASAEAEVSLAISDNLSIGLRGAISSGGWALEGRLDAEKEILLNEFLPASISIPQEVAALSFRSVEVALKREGKESSVSFIVTGQLKLSLGDAGEMSVTRLELHYTGATDTKEYEWKIVCAGKIALLANNPTAHDWLIHGEGELTISKGTAGAAIKFVSAQGITVEELPLLLPQKVTPEGIQWSAVKFTLKEIELGKDREQGWYFSSSFELQKVRLPGFIDSVFPNEGIRVRLALKSKQASITLEKTFFDHTFESFSLPAVGSIPAFSSGKSRLQLGDLKITIGKKAGIEVALKYWLPEHTNDLFGKDADGKPLRIFDVFNPLTPDAGKTLSVSFFARVPEGESAPKIGAAISSLPLLPLEKEGEYYLFNLGPKPEGEKYGKYGCIKFQMPEFAFDMKKGGFTLGFAFGIAKQLAVPLGPLKKMLEGSAVKDWAKRLPDALPIPFPFNPGIFKDNQLDVAQAVSYYRLLMGEDMHPDGVKVLNDIAAIANRLPDGFKNYLSLNNPEGTFDMKFKLTLDPKGGFDVQFSTNPGLRLLFFNPPFAVQGIELRSFSFGTLLGGQLFSLRIDADFEQFDLVQLLTSLLVEGPNDYLGNPAKFGTKLSLEELFIIIIHQTKIPIPVPLFYKRVAINYYGLGDFGFGAGVQFKQPEFDLLEAAGMLADLVAFLSQPGTHLDPDKVYENFNLRFVIEPAHVSLPKVAGGQQLTLLDRGEISLYRIFASLANAIKFMDIGDAINIVPLKQRVFLGSTQAPVKFVCIDLPTIDWLLTTPAEFISVAHRDMNIDAEQANQWLKIIPGPNDVPVRAEDKGLVSYFRGAWKPLYAEFECVFGLVALDVRQFRMGLRIKGKVSGIFDFEATAFTNVKREAPYFYLYGENKTMIWLAGLQVFSGETKIEFTPGRFAASGQFDILNAQALFYMGGRYSGHFDATRFQLAGGLTGKLLIFALEGDGHIASDGIGGEIGLQGTPKTGFGITVSDQRIALTIKLDLGWTSFSSKVEVLPNDNNPELNLELNSSSIAGLLSMRIKFFCKAFDTRASGDFYLFLLGQQVLQGSTSLNGNSFSAEGWLRISLIPGTALNIYVRGTISAGQFMLSGEGTFVVNPLPEVGCKASISTNGIRGTVTIAGVDYGFGIIGCNGDVIIVLTAAKVTSYIDRNGFHFNSKPPCSMPALSQKEEPCRMPESRKMFTEGTELLVRSYAQVSRVRSSTMKKVAEHSTDEFTLLLAAAKAKTRGGKTSFRTLLALEPRSQQTKLVKEIREYIALYMRKAGNTVPFDLTGMRLGFGLTGHSEGRLHMELPAHGLNVSSSFSNLSQGYDLFEAVAMQLAGKKKKTAGKKSTLAKKAVKKKKMVKKATTASRKKSVPLKKATPKKAAKKKKVVKKAAPASRKKSVPLKKATPEKAAKKKKVVKKATTASRRKSLALKKATPKKAAKKKKAVKKTVSAARKKTTKAPAGRKRA